MLRGKAKRLLVLFVLVGGLLPVFPGVVASAQAGDAPSGSVADGWSWDV